MKKFLLIITLWLGAVHITEACSCMGASDFITTVTDENFPPDLIIRGVKTADHHYGMKFQIREVLKGQENRSNITVWGDNGALCRVYTSGFSTGEELILALYKTDKMGNDIHAAEHPENLEKDEDYHLSVCGVHFLSLENNQVKGAVTATQNQISFSNFKKLLKAESPTPPEGKNFLIYPNPAPAGQINISYHLPAVNALTISLYNIIGKVVKEYEVPVTTEKGILEIDAKDVSDGIYFLDIRAKGYRHLEKIIIH